ncbi:ArsR/SmtB family transcription factor [Nocardia rhizosphaerihabitans]|uniref:Transcriptional regulator n=1 Tax=Nocardia rhizosphaerihabitans TaxID=1691570 RepID=A0ABQ2KC01_9NOCA|nr:winged helix-turn-helix domain-containing protein [Nocardia rhizosphaerihabitans]GGN77143.1 transcriptional regulator [Nocardia rhizosphaerihabitans]
MDLVDRLEELERRVAALEQSGGGDAQLPWAVARLRKEFDDAGVRNGGVLLAGALQLPTGERLDWQAQFATDAIVGDVWTIEAANCLAVLANPVRLRLLREIVYGRRTAADLAAIEELGTSAEIYQHLRQLAAVGWLQTAGLGRFEVPEGRLVPLLAALASAQR